MLPTFSAFVIVSHKNLHYTEIIYSSELVVNSSKNTKEFLWIVNKSA
jgi:hypothetical protein